MKAQAELDTLSKFAARLGEERKRVHPHQGNFAAKLGISQGRQSLYERGERELKADYLCEVAKLGIDIAYVVTGQRSSDSLDEQTSAIVSSVRRLADDQRHSLLNFLATIAPDPADPE